MAKIKSFNGDTTLNDGTNYETYFVEQFFGLPESRAKMVGRDSQHPTFASLDRQGRTLFVETIIKGGGSPAGLARIYDTDRDTPHKLAITDDDGTNERFVYAVCEMLKQAPERSGLVYVARLRIDGDARWRTENVVQQIQTGVSDGNTVPFVNNGDDYARPEFWLTPIQPKSSNDYGDYIVCNVVWNKDEAAQSVPIELTGGGWDTQTLYGNGQLSFTDGRDIRVEVDGVEVNRYLDTADVSTSTATKVWANLDFLPKPPTVNLAQDYTDQGVPDVIFADGDISEFPDSGYLYIEGDTGGDEFFYYKEKNDAKREFRDISRQEALNSRQYHSAGKEIQWVQHWVVIKFGNPDAGAAPSDPDFEPALDLSASTNAMWEYDDVFWHNARPNRPYQWERGIYGNIELSHQTTTFYEGQHVIFRDPDPADVAGMVTAGDDRGEIDGLFVHLRLPYDLAASNQLVTDDEKWADDLGDFGATIDVEINGEWEGQKIVSDPASTGTWEDTTNNTHDLDDVSDHVRFDLNKPGVSGSTNRWGIRRVEVNFDSSQHATSSFASSELTPYSWDARVVNETTGEEFKIKYMGHAGDNIIISVPDGTVYYDVVGRLRIFQAISFPEGLAKEWFTFAPGTNNITYHETGSVEVQLEANFRERYYD